MNELWKDVWIDVYEDSDERNVKLWPKIDSSACYAYWNTTTKSDRCRKR
jgi:hypothetical protein